MEGQSGLNGTLDSPGRRGIYDEQSSLADWPIGSRKDDNSGGSSKEI